MFVEQVRERASDWLIIGTVVGFTSTMMVNVEKRDTEVA